MTRILPLLALTLAIASAFVPRMRSNYGNTKLNVSDIFDVRALYVFFEVKRVVSVP